MADPLRFELKRLRKDMIKYSLPPDYVLRFHEWYVTQRLPEQRADMRLPRRARWSIRACSALVLLLLLVVWALVGLTLSLANDEGLAGALMEVREEPCLLYNNPLLQEVARPLFNCQAACQGLSQVPVQEMLSREQFEHQYAYTGRPVLVRGATRNWTAMEAFDFSFLRRVFTSSEEVISVNQKDCQFFPYRTEFTDLYEAFQMPEERVNFGPGEKNWYFGWSNCHYGTARELRKHYSRPFFLPTDSESSHVDWLFMGGPGPGAHVHLDHVGRPSWQAQISGSKTWTLYPVPECESICPSGLNVTMRAGDILIIDTNQWYHATTIHPGKLSISIGSEFD